MPRVMRQGRLGLPVVYETWSDWRGEQAGAAAAAAAQGSVAPGGQPCGTCWGQGRILAAAPNGEGLIPGLCWGCGGRGSVAITG